MACAELQKEQLWLGTVKRGGGGGCGGGCGGGGDGGGGGGSGGGSAHCYLKLTILILSG